MEPVASFPGEPRPLLALRGEASQAVATTLVLDPYSRPVTRTQQSGAERPVAAVPATVPRRLLAFVLDALVLSALVTVLNLMLDRVVGPAFSFSSDPTVLSGAVVRHPGRVLVDSVAGIAAGLGYFTLSWSRWAATPGQRLMAIAVRSSAGPQLTLGQAMVRYLALGGWVIPALQAVTRDPVVLAAGWAAVLLWYAVLLVTTVRHPMRRGLHDCLAGTLVSRGNRIEPGTDQPPAGDRLP